MEKNIEELVSSREKFNSFIYTPLDEALKELEKRQKDKKLKKEISSFLNDDIPKNFNSGLKAIFFSYLTPNYEIRRFFSIVDAIDSLEPVFLEYSDDKFVTENERKYALGKLRFYNGTGNRGGTKIDSANIIEFNKFNGKKISEVKTFWGQSLLDFHHDFFETSFRPLKKASNYDVSNWLKTHGETPKEYYKAILALALVNGIMFENYMLDIKEMSFTKEVFLPAFIYLSKKFGCKPLIVALEPTDIEGDLFWMCYPGSDKKLINKKD